MKFDRFMVAVEIASNGKIARFTDPEFRCLVSGIWPLAAKAEPRGRLTISGHPATSKDVANQARCSVAVAKRTLEKMESLRMLDYDEDHGWLTVHDWDELNPKPKVDPTHNRRQALFRDRDLRLKIRKRDGDMCRYCGVEVDWNDRRGRTGGTYDHVDPRGPNSEDNLVVACRSCNSSKGNRPIKPRDLDPDLDPKQKDLDPPHAGAADAPSISTSLSSSGSSGQEESKRRADVLECFAYWQERCGKPKAKLTAERKAKVNARLDEGYTVLDIRKGIDGAATAPPRSDDGVVHDDLVSICRNGAQLERYMARADAKPLRPVSRMHTSREPSERSLRILADIRAQHEAEDAGS